MSSNMNVQAFHSTNVEEKALPKYLPPASNTQLTFDFIHRSYDPDLIRVHSGEIFFSQKFLVDEHFVPENSLKVRRAEFRKGAKNYRFELFFCSDGRVTFFYAAETIPKKLFEMYNLPSLEEAAKQFSPQIRLKLKMKAQRSTPTDSELKLLINAAVDRAYKVEYLFYRSEHFAPVSSRLAQKYSVLKVLREYFDERPKQTTIKAVKEILTQPMFSHLEFPKEMGAFYSYLDRAIKAKDLQKFTLGRLNVNANAKKINDDVLELIRIFGGHANGISAEMVMILVNTVLIVFPNINGKKLLEIRTIQTKLVELKTDIKIYKEGEDFVKKRLSAYLHMHSALHPFDQFFMDEWWLEFACRKSNKRIRKIVLGIMDGRSKKMVNKWLVHGLNSEIIKSFLFETIELCRGRFSAEFLCDLASYNVCKEMSRMFNYLVHKCRKLPNKFAWTKTSEPNRKEIERFWEIFGSHYLSPHVGATGQGITATRENASPAKIIEILIEDPAFLEDEAEVDRLIDHLFNQYNTKSVHLDLDSPNEIFRDNKAINAITLEPVDYAFMFGIKDSRKYERSEITFRGRDYQTFDKNISRICHDKRVDFYYHDRFPDSVFVFLEDSMDLVGELNFYDPMPKAIVNQTPEDKAALGILCGKQAKMITESLQLKPNGIAKIKELTGGVNPTEIGMGLLNLMKPHHHTSVDHLNPAAVQPIEIDAFDPKTKNEYKSDRQRKTKKARPISSKGLMDDNLTALYG